MNTLIEKYKNISTDAIKKIVGIREDIDFVKFLKTYYGDKPLVGVEIGVNRGDNSESMLKTLNIKKLYVIDPYLEIDLYGNAEERKQDAFNRLKYYGNKVCFIYKKSLDAIADIPDDLDFVYIDGEHTYPSVSSEIRLYYPKIKKGGVLGFDDFSPRCLGVANAIIEFVFENNFELLSGKFTDCWIVKEG